MPVKLLKRKLFNGKRFLAYEIIKRLEEQDQKDILKQLQLAVTAKENKEKISTRLHITKMLVSDL